MKCKTLLWLETSQRGSRVVMITSVWRQLIKTPVDQADGLGMSTKVVDHIYLLLLKGNGSSSLGALLSSTSF